MKKQLIAFTAFTAITIGAASQASAASVHTVKKGDTLWSISQANNVTVQNIQNWNNLSSTIIYPNQQLQIGGNAKEAEKTVTPAENGANTYTVKSGDTLFVIASNHGISVSELKSWNGLSSDLIHPGDKLSVKGTVKKEAAVQPKKASAQSEKATTQPKQAAGQSKPVSAPENASKELTVTATAYTANCPGCSGVTATGINLKANPNQKVIAVDPNVIPLGTKVWVEGYGEAIAGDTGGAIKGNKIDVFIPSKQAASNWGIKKVKIKVL
ncbi:peptidoglycan-binding protein [Pueribacillus theae]|uniref:Peptidoglycan-binding protein n=1 Tax=Pueribacillus theae TaxID=2171751 RepID=A0A2U1K6X2_9BACI|nr:LysM peptidoglycan-binding and 3D domain-containing protein [Pueribacillus theae]PWA12703.1 peptidoglycan-binding protein [Pueribacillus theae]